MNDLSDLQQKLSAAIAGAADLNVLNDIRVAALGKKGELTEALKSLASLEGDARKARGQELNIIKNEIGNLLDARQAVLAETALNEKLATESVDVTLPVQPKQAGRVHPISQTIEEVTAIFADMGFALKGGPDIETDFYNFDALNFPPHHPAREMHDTFYLKDQREGQRALLRTHTSTVQVRTMMAQKPPIRVIAAGRTYRSDSDQTHSPMFHQIEGLFIDKDVTMGHLKWCLREFLSAFFGVPDLPIRLRPSFFPFVEPGAEVDIGCSRKGGELKIGNYGAGDQEWMEILGCGMVHPNVLESCGIDSTEYQGFAFGMGVERLAMLKYGIPDLRPMYDSDIRWLGHYGFSAFQRPNLVEGL